MARSGRPFSEMLIGLSLDGSQFQDTMANINRTIKSSESVMKANLKVLGNAEKSYDDLSKHMDNLTDVYTAQEKKLDKLQQAHQEAIDTYGASSKEAQKYAAQINNTVGAMATLDRQMKNTKKEMIYVEEGVNDLTKEFKDHDKQMKTMVDSYKKAGNETAAYEEKQKGLTRQIDVTERAIEAQRKVIERMNTEFGESSEEAKKAAQSLKNLEDRSRLLGAELSDTNTQLGRLGDAGNALISEQQNLSRQFDRTRTAIREQEQAVDNLRQAYGEGSREVQDAERRLADLREEAGRTEQALNNLDSEFRNLGDSSTVNPDGLEEVDSKLDGLNDKAGIVGAALAAALGATGAAVVSEIEEAIQKIGVLQGGIKDYRRSLEAGVKDSSFSRQSSVYGFKEDPSGKKLENISTMTAFDAPEVGKAMNMLMKTYGYTFEQAQAQLIKASRGGLTELDELVEYLGNRDVSKLSNAAKKDLADYMITGANKAVASGGARNSDNALDFYNEAYVRAQDFSDTQTDALLEAGGKAAVQARKNFKETQDFAQYMRDLQAAIAKKQGPDESKQRQAWITANGTQGEMLNLTAIKELVSGNATPQYAQESYEDSAGNTQTREVVVDGDLTEEEKQLVEATNSYQEAMGKIKSELVGIGANVLPQLVPVFERIGELVKKYAPVLDGFVAGLLETSGGFTTQFEKIFEKIRDFLKPVEEYIEKITGWEINLTSIGKVLGTVTAAFAMFAAVNLPVKMLGKFLGMFTDNKFVNFLSKGVVGKVLAGPMGVVSARQERRAALAAQPPAPPVYGPAVPTRRQRISNRATRIKTSVSGWMNRQRNQGIMPSAGIATPDREARVRAAGERHRAMVGNGARRVGGVAKGVGKGALGAVKGVGRGLGGAMGMLGGPIGIILMALPLIIPLIKKLYNEFEPFKKLVDGTWAMMKNFWEWLKPVLANLWTDLKAGLADAWAAIQPILSALWGKVQEFWTWLKPILADMWTGLKDGLSNAWTTVKPILEGLWTTVKTVFGWIMDYFNLYWTTVKTVFGFVKGLFTDFGGTVGGLWTTIKTKFSEGIAFVKTKVIEWVLSFGTKVSELKTSITTKISGLWTSVKTGFSNGIAYVKEKVSGWVTSFITKVAELRSNIVGKISGLWTSLKTNFLNGISYIKTKVAEWVTSFKTKISEMRTGVIERISSLWTNVKTNFSNGVKYVKDKVLDFKNNVVNRFKDMKDEASKMVNQLIENVKGMPKKLKDGIAAGKEKLKEGARTMINGLIQGIEGGINRVIGGANTVLGYLGVGKSGKISKIDIAEYAKGTPKGGHPGGLAMVNDAKGGKYRELVRTPDGEMFIPEGRNVMMNLPKGSEVLDAKKTAKYAGIGHVPHYAKGVGDLLGNLWKGAKNKAGKGIDKVKDWSKEALDWVSSKVDVKAMLSNAIGKISDISGSINNQMLKGIVGKTVSSATDMLFKKGQEAKAADAGGESGSKYKGKWGAISNKWGVYDYLYNAVMKVVKDFPQAVITSGQRNGSRTTFGSLSDHASHAGIDISGYGRNGSPSYMAMANRIFKDSSVKYVIANNLWKKKSGGGYSRFAPGGHMNHVHVSGYQPKQASARAKKFARGAIVNSPTAGIFGEAGPEALIPLSNGRRTRGLSLLNQAARIMGQEVTPKGTQGNPELNELKTMVAQQGQMINLLTQLVLKDNSLYLDGKEVYNTVESHKNKATIKTNIARGTL